jgi:hypothetical protein
MNLYKSKGSESNIFYLTKRSAWCPADSGSFTGMATNYQVVAESAARAVIQVQNTPTPVNPSATPHIVVVQYNTLPPE